MSAEVEPSVSLFYEQDGSELPLGGPGEYVLGRGPLVKITDKRVSRNHAVLCLQDDGTVKICPKHVNPFFHKKSKGDGKFVTISRNDWHVMSNNDQVSFLPNELIYSIKISLPPLATTPILSATSEKSDNVAPKGTTADASGTRGTVDVLTDTTTEASLSSESNKNPPVPGLSTSVSGSSGKERYLPAWMKGGIPLADSVTVKKEKKEKQAPKRNAKSKTDTSSSLLIEPNTEDAAIISSSDDRKDPVAVSKRTTVATKKSSSSVSSTEATESAVATKKKSNSNAASTEGTKSDKPDKPDTASTAGLSVKKKLPLCPYGKKCYRKNPAHFKEFSHDDNPDDSEDEEAMEEEGEKPECPYGTSCYRRNPEHRKQFKHTAPPATPPKASGKRATVRTSTRTRKKPKKSVLSGESDDEGEPNTYDYNDSFIDDEERGSGSSSSTSYKGDSEDEDWCLPPAEDDGEDVTELVSEAQDFMSNKKMHRTS